jgi:OmpA-OmpF porin, OOP family
MKKIKCIAFSVCCFFAFAASAQEYKIENNEVKTTAAIKFKAGSAELLPESDAALQAIKKYLDDKTYITLLRVEAHTDNSGDAEANQLLSEKRADAICDKLVALGVNCNRLLPVGFGGHKPIATNSTPEGKTENRRISFVNATLKGNAIGNMPVDGGGKVVGNACK